MFLAPPQLPKSTRQRRSASMGLAALAAVALFGGGLAVGGSDSCRFSYNLQIFLFSPQFPLFVTAYDFSIDCASTTSSEWNDRLNKPLGSNVETHIEDGADDRYCNTGYTHCFCGSFYLPASTNHSFFSDPHIFVFCLYCRSVGAT